MLQIMEARPPHIMFERRAIEDRDASQKSGHKVYRDVDYVRVQQPGSRDTYYDIAASWLKKQEDKLRIGSIDAPKPEWFERYKSIYALFLQGREAPVQGTHVRQWPIASPAEIEMLCAALVFTVEDLAGLNEEGTGRLGMGGRLLRDKARTWLESAANTGQATEKISALEIEQEQMRQQIADRDALIRDLSTRLDVLETRRGPGRPPSKEAA